MKSNSLPTFHHLPSNGLTPVMKALQAQTGTQNHSPYLKAILSGQASHNNNEKKVALSNPDREAALRYIKESRMLKK